MRFHWQNLNEKRGGKVGWGIVHGRAWLSITQRTELAWCWALRPRLELEAFVESGGMISGDRHATAHVSLFGIGFYLSVTTPILSRFYSWASKSDGRRFGAALRWDRTLKLDIDAGTREMSWNSKDPWYLKGIRIDFADLIFGRSKHSRECLSTHNVVIPMPEGGYPATVELDRCKWKRPRWPFAIVRYGSVVDIPNGIPHAGKGENSWDCGDDGTYGMNPQVETVEDAIAAVVASCMKDRRRYGQASFLQDKEPVMANAN